MATLADLKKRRGTDFNKLTKALEKTNNQNNSDDEGFWKLERDSAGNGSAVIRFLAAHESDDLPWVLIKSHSFQASTGRWYIENCRSTINEPDPVVEQNNVLWKGSEADKKQASAQKIKSNYIAQILVVSDPKHPENNGKVFFYKFGKKIFSKIMDAAKPTFEDEEPVNVFDYWEGANFKLRVKTVEGFPNYDSSLFESPSAISDDEDEILEIVNKQKSLGKFIDPSNFKSYDELKKKLESVQTASSATTKKAEDIAKEMRAETTKDVKEPDPVETNVSKSEEISDDDTEKWFQDNMDLS